MGIRFSYIALCLALGVSALGCHKDYSLPEAGSPAAILYTAKCGLCHPVYHPQTHTFTGWEFVIIRMEKNASDVGMGPLLSEEEKSTILSYQKKYARETLF